MKIHEVIIESQQDIDEISLRGIKSAAGNIGQTIGKVAGGTAGVATQFGKGLKQGWQQGFTPYPVDDDEADTKTPPSSSEMTKIKSIVNQLGPAQKAALASELNKSLNTVPQKPQTLDLNKLKQQNQAKQARDQANQQQAIKQMQQTQQSNAAAAAAAADLAARVKAEKQKPGFQQDKGLLRQAAAKGIHESQQKPAVEFHSKFLGVNI